MILSLERMCSFLWFPYKTASIAYIALCIFLTAVKKSAHNALGIYNHTIIWICSSVCLSANYSAVFGPIDPKLGRKVHGQIAFPQAANSNVLTIILIR